MTDQQQYPTREQIAARLTGDIFDAVPDDNDMQHVLTLAAAILSQPTPSAEATVLVPVSLIERAAELLDKHHPGITSARLRAVLFPQPTPSAAPPSIADMAPGTTPVVCICGSTRFRDEMTDANRRLTLGGSIVVAPGVFGHSGDTMTDEQKTALDALHFQKIDLAHSIYVVNPGGYIGESTTREIAYAERAGKPVVYLVDPSTIRDVTEPATPEATS